MTILPIILLDDGGVMNDNRLRGQQWPLLVGAFFTPRLGGTPTAWAEANRLVTQRLFEPANWVRRVQASSDYAHFERAYWLDWLSEMGRLVGITLPREEVCIHLAQQAESAIIPHIRSAFPGATEAIRRLHTEGYTLHTASGEPSAHLTLYLEGMSVRECFGRLYGADLLNTLKEGPAYYHQLFADLQIAPGDALIVDDSPRALAWANSLGARTVLVGATQESSPGMTHIRSLAQLPALLQKRG
jgi:HAD superfamily hydrolase (TIGR01509 family)